MNFGQIEAFVKVVELDSILGDKKCDFYEFADEKLVFIAPNDGYYIRK